MFNVYLMGENVYDVRNASMRLELIREQNYAAANVTSFKVDFRVRTRDRCVTFAAC